MSDPVSSPLEQLAQRIREGEVVFFVGSGFSIDSEGMSAENIVWRLWIRLEGLCFHAGLGGEGEKVWKRFRGTFLGKHGEVRLPNSGAFQIPPTSKGRSSIHPQVSEAVKALSQKYYELNDWLCDAYGELLIQWAKKTSGKCRAVKALNDWEGDAWCSLEPQHRKPFSGIPGAVLRMAISCEPEKRNSHTDQRALGKLVLMSAFGFFDEQTLAGRCQGADRAHSDKTGANGNTNPAAALARIYGGRLRLRHHVLARLAREGYCPTIITTNFDLLLEGALGMSGLEEEGHSTSQAHSPMESLSLQIPRYDVISDPAGFYRRGKAFRTATLLKIHGCAGRVREAIQKKGEDAVPLPSLQPYLRQVVYTYREIQNWRSDHWTADLLRTLLRTRALVFAAYSTMDPVVHDTFRSVYEEMERNSHGGHGGTGREGINEKERKAPAYYLGWSGSEGSTEFHADQVLRSASRAVEQPHTDDVHPHYLRFGSPQSEHLTLDETMGFLAHEVFRAQQMEALKTELAALVARLTGRRRPKEDVADFLRRFEQFRTKEMTGVRKAFLSRNSQSGSEESSTEDRAEARRQLRRSLGWSMGFHPALRREWALALALGQRHGSGTLGAADLANWMRQPDWYYPASERPGWTAWSAVLEMALKNMARALCCEGTSEVEPTHDVLPTVTVPYVAKEGALSRLTLTLQLGGLDRLDKPPTTAGFSSRRVVWTFPEDALPWASEPPPRLTSKTGKEAKGTRRGLGAVVWRTQPAADRIWKWAIGAETDVTDLERQLGISAEGQTPFSRSGKSA